MSTTTTVPAVTDGLLAALQTGPVQVFESWPGPEAAPEMIVLGEVEWDSYEIATIKAGRKHRQEEYGIGFEVFVVGAEGTTPASPKAARPRGFEIFGDVEDVLADDVTGGTDFTTVQFIVSAPRTAGPRVFERGWAYRVAGVFQVRARLL
jgi:hypothetical protein